MICFCKCVSSWMALDICGAAALLLQPNIRLQDLPLSKDVHCREQPTASLQVQIGSSGT